MNQDNGMRNSCFPADLILNESESEANQSHPGLILHYCSRCRHTKECKYPNGCPGLCFLYELPYQLNKHRKSRYPNKGQEPELKNIKRIFLKSIFSHCKYKFLNV